MIQCVSLDGDKL